MSDWKYRIEVRETTSPLPWEARVFGSCNGGNDYAMLKILHGRDKKSAFAVAERWCDLNQRRPDVREYEPAEAVRGG